MIITLLPQRRDMSLTLERAGDALVINGERFDFSALPEGATLPRDAVACDWLASDVERVGGVLHLSLILPHGPIGEMAVPFAPAALDDPAEGPVLLPTPNREYAE